MTTETKDKPYFSRMYFITVTDWKAKLGDKVFCTWLDLLTQVNRTPANVARIGNKNTITLSLEGLAKVLKCSVNTLKAHVRKLWDFALVDLVEWEGDFKRGSKAINVVVYNYPMNDAGLADQPLKQIRSYEKDYNAGTAKSYVMLQRAELQTPTPESNTKPVALPVAETEAGAVSYEEYISTFADVIEADRTAVNMSELEAAAESYFDGINETSPQTFDGTKNASHQKIDGLENVSHQKIDGLENVSHQKIDSISNTNSFSYSFKTNSLDNPFRTNSLDNESNTNNLDKSFNNKSSSSFSNSISEVSSNEEEEMISNNWQLIENVMNEREIPAHRINQVKAEVFKQQLTMPVTEYNVHAQIDFMIEKEKTARIVLYGVYFVNGIIDLAAANEAPKEVDVNEKFYRDLLEKADRAELAGDTEMAYRLRDDVLSWRTQALLKNSTGGTSLVKYDWLRDPEGIFAK